MLDRYFDTTHASTTIIIKSIYQVVHSIMIWLLFPDVFRYPLSVVPT